MKDLLVFVFVCAAALDALDAVVLEGRKDDARFLMLLLDLFS